MRGPFLHTPIPRDLQLEAKLYPEWPVILGWMIDGCLDWRSNGWFGRRWWWTQRLNISRHRTSSADG
jgi:hypothetical protein